MFTGFPEETLQFFLDIRFHNSISYFEEHRERFRQDVQAPFYAFIEELAPKLRTIDPQMELRPYKCLARIRREACPPNAKRLGLNTPCAHTGRCDEAHCGDDCMCRGTAILHRPMRGQRMAVILVDEALGY